MIDRELVRGVNDGSVPCMTGSVSGIVADAWVSIRVKGGGTASIAFQRSADPAKGENVSNPPPGTRKVWEVNLAPGRREWQQIPSGTEFLDYVINANGPGFLCVELKAK